MRSFALWYSLQDDTIKEAKEISVHINFWNIKNKYSFDFGFLLEDLSKVKKMSLYVPFKLKIDDIKDLGSVISKNNKLVNSIFNENFTVTAGEPKKLVVNGNGNKDEFVIYSLDIKDQVKVLEVNAPGSIVEINLNNIPLNEKKRFYFRLRIETKNKIALVDDQIKGISVFSDQFTNTEIIDFRFNDIRSCSDEIREKYEKGQKFKYIAIHYLLMRDASDIIIYNGREISSRVLETDLWKNYIDEISHTMIAYHLKKKAKKIYNENENKYYIKEYIDDFSELIRFQYKKGTKLIFLIYIFVAILIGACSGILGNLATKVLGIN